MCFPGAPLYSEHEWRCTAETGITACITSTAQHYPEADVSLCFQAHVTATLHACLGTRVLFEKGPVACSDEAIRCGDTRSSRFHERVAPPKIKSTRWHIARTRLRVGHSLTLICAGLVVLVVLLGTTVSVTLSRTASMQMSHTRFQAGATLSRHIRRAHEQRFAHCHAVRSLLLPCLLVYNLAAHHRARYCTQQQPWLPPPLPPPCPRPNDLRGPRRSTVRSSREMMSRKEGRA